jgi:hypothetical protein
MPAYFAQLIVCMRALLSTDNRALIPGIARTGRSPRLAKSSRVLASYLGCATSTSRCSLEDILQGAPWSLAVWGSEGEGSGPSEPSVKPPEVSS